MITHPTLIRFRPFCVPLIAMWLASSAHAATVVDLARARASMARQPVAELAVEMQRLRDRGATLDLVNVLREQVLAGPLDAIAREALLDSGIHLLAELPPHAASRALASELAGRPAQVFVRGDPDHGSNTVPLYDVGAVARFAQRGWERRDSREGAMAAIRTRDLAPLERFAASANAAAVDPDKAGVLDAFSAVETLDLLAYRAALVNFAAGGGHVDELLLVFARRLRDPELFALLFEHCDSAVALRAIAEIPHLLDGDEAVTQLAHAMKRARLASAALLTMSELARSRDSARRVLFESLSHPQHGASAAAALGRLQDASIASDLGRALASAPDEATRRHLVLALHFDGGSAARRALEGFAKSGKGSSELRKEVSAWLAH